MVLRRVVDKGGIYYSERERERQVYDFHQSWRFSSTSLVGFLAGHWLLCRVLGALTAVGISPGTLKREG